MKQLFYSLCLTTLFSQYSFGQIVGGRDNGEMAPKSVEASKLNGGAIVSDVNIVSGEYTSSIPLGTIGTPGGLSFSLSVDYASNASVGTTAPVSSGIPYGEGWNLSLPTISIEADVFHKYLLSQEDYQHQLCGAGQNGFVMNYDGPAVPSDPVNKYTGLDHGDLYWFAPQLSIPGIASGRLVFKYLDQSVSPNQLVFGLQGFESPVEVRMINTVSSNVTTSKWTVTLADGTKYWFDLVQNSFNSPMNTRVLTYDKCTSAGTNNAAGAVNTGSYVLSGSNLENHILNSILPKLSSAVWYCTKITNNSIENQQVELVYDKYGQFNFYNEFAPANAANQASNAGINNTLNNNLIGDFSTYRDIILKKVVSKVDNQSFEIMELDYQTLTSALTTYPNILIDYNTDPNAEQVDNMYTSTSVYKKGGSSSYSGWSRYRHVKAGDYYADMLAAEPNNIDPSNPYVKPLSGYRRATGLSGNTLDFKDGFLESDRIQPQKMIPGDIYEVRTKINNTRGTVDIAVVSGDLNTTPSSPYANFSTLNTQAGEWYSEQYYDDTRGIELFSTFNSAFKWWRPLQQSSQNPYNNQLRTSNFFVMPNVPQGYGGFHLQVGPGSSDVDYSTPPEALWQYLNNPPNPAQSWRGKEAYAFMPLSLTTGNNPVNYMYKSGANLAHNFGNGFPWGMMVPMYQGMEPYGPLHEKSMFQCWYLNQYTYGQNPGGGVDKHRPTTMGYQDPSRTIEAELEEIELIRYTKNPYMLRGVRIYRVNNGNETTGKQLIAQKQLDYTFATKNLIENYDYYDYTGGNVAVVEDNQRKRIVFFLSKVHELPLNATLYASNFGLTTQEAANVLTTSFGYTDANTNTATSLYEVRGEKIHVLSSITNHLGGVTTITYKTIDNSSFSDNYNPQRSTMAVQNGYSSYGDGVLYTVSVTVDQVQKQDANGTQAWIYQFSNPIIKHNQYLLNNNHFRNAFAQSRSKGFKNVRIYQPSVNGVTAYTDIEHFGALVSDLPTTSSPNGTGTYLSDLETVCFGKVKSTKSYMNGILNNETTNTYALTQAFENGAIRPSFKKSSPSYSADMTAPYLYEDYYLNQSLYTSLTENLQDLNTYYGTYNPTIPQGEQPKMMEGYFYADILAANQNRAWVFNSYFIKLVSTSTKQYEDGEYKMPAAPAPCFDRFGNPVPCPIVVIEPAGCSSTLETTRKLIETKTDYTYYEADYTGKAVGTAYHNLYAINPASPATINFSSYGMGSGSRSQGTILLKHEPSWQLASTTVTSPQMTSAMKKEEYFYFYDLVNRYDRHWYLYDLVSNSKFSVQVINGDTIAVNNIVTNVIRTNTNSLPRYEGMESSRTHNTRSFAFQKTGSSKNSSDPEPFSKSEYYHFDNSWTYATSQTYQPVMLRSVAVQIDTMPQTNGNADFRMWRIDRANTYIADFKAITASIQPDGKSYIYSMLSPYDQLKTKTITERNRLLMPQTMEDQMGVKTRYNINTTITAGSMTNLGLVESIVVGYGRTDALTSSFEYNNQGLLKKMTEPSARYVEYLYDNYLRLIKTTENGTRILSESVYTVWDKNVAWNFEERANKNSILTTIYNSSITNDKEMLKSFVDPLGRDHSTLQAYYDLSSTLVKTHSPTVEYDSWNRLVKTYESYPGSGPLMDLSTNTNTSFAEQKYENQLTGRIIKAANYGEAIATSTHTVQNAYRLVNGVVAYCELGLNNEEAKVMMRSTGSGAGFYFLRQTNTDQDGKQTLTYTNAFGQLAARMTYSSAGVKAVTIFGYDSYGNLNKVINPNDQVSTYLYNILGELVMETTPDAGTKRYMYNKLGLVSVEQDQYERTRTIPSGTFVPRYRVYKYDDYGKLTGVGVMDVTLSSGQQYDALYYATANVSSFIYTFSNASTYDWLCNYWITNKFQQMVPVNVTPASFSIQQWEKSFAYGVTQGQNTIGKLTLESSYNNAGVKILKNAYTYDATGNVASQLATFSPINADGATNITTSKIDYVSYNYRRSLLEEKVDVDNDNTTDLHMFFAYDRLNRLTGISAAMGAVNTSADATLLVSYTYDIDGKLTKKEHRIDDGTAINRLAMEIAYNYDVRDRLTSIEAKNAALSVARFGLFYDNQAPVSGATTVTAHQNWNGNINGALAEYNFSTADNVISNFNGTTLYGYQYDPMNRLTKADAAIGDFITQNAVSGPLIGDEECTYDKSGNILSLKRSVRGMGANFTETEWWNYSYTTGTNKLSGVTGQNAYSVNRTYTYDANGNLSTDSYKQITQPMQYGRAAYTFHITKSSDMIDYLYDTKDQRIYKKVDATDNNLDNEAYYLQDVMGRTLAIKETQNGVTGWQYFINGPEREMSVKPTTAQAPGNNTSNTNKRVGFTQTNAFVYDHLGNTRVSYSAQSWDIANSRVKFKVEYIADYAPYGKIIREFVSNERERYLTTEHERDVETGLDYRGARYYDSDIARFLSLDPLAKQYPGWSAYNYVMGNPILLVDPTGKSPENTDDPREDWMDDDYTLGTNEGGWTKNHLLLNQAFGDPNGFNATIKSKYSTKQVSKDEKFWRWMPVENVGVRATFWMHFKYSTFTDASSKQQKLTFSGWGGTTADNPTFGGSVKVMYQGKVYSSGTIRQPSGDSMNEKIEGMSYFGNVMLKLPPDPKSAVTIVVNVQSGSSNSDDRVVNSGGFVVSGSVTYTLYKP